MDRAGVTPVVGTVLMLGVVFAAAIVVLLVAMNARQDAGTPPAAYAFAADTQGGSIKVTKAPVGALWEDLRVDGCTGVPTGGVHACDLVTGCAGHVAIVDIEANTLLASFDFPQATTTSPP